MPDTVKPIDPAVPATPPAPAIDPALPAPVPGDKLGTSTPDDFAATNSALEDLLKRAEADEETAPEAKPEPAPEAKPEAKPETAPIPTGDEFEKVELPPYTKPASVTAFATVKQMARERISAIEKEREELAKKLATAEETLKKSPAPTDNEELAELRKFRLKFDVEADPSFRSWDKSVKDNEALIYARLRTSGVEEASIKRIEEIGGPGQVDWDALGEKVSPALKRYIEGKLFENEDLHEKKKAAIAAAKENASEFVKTRQEELYQNTEGRSKQVVAEFEALKPQMSWLQEVNPPVSATAEEKAKAEANNVLVKRVEADLQEAISDDSPRMRAVLLAGFAQLMRLRADTASTAESHKAEIARLEASLKEKVELIERIKKSSTARLSSAGTSPGETKPRAKVDYSEDGASALERHLREARAQAE